MVNIIAKRVDVSEIMKDGECYYLDEFSTVQHAISYIDELNQEI